MAVGGVSIPAGIEDPDVGRAEEEDPRKWGGVKAENDLEGGRRDGVGMGSPSKSGLL